MTTFETLQPLEPRLIPPKGVSTGVSPDGLEVSILFDSFELRLDGDEQMVTVAVSTSRLPVTIGDDTSVAGYLAHARGSVLLSSGARAWVSIHFAGAAATLSWPVGQAPPDEQQRVPIDLLPKQRVDLLGCFRIDLHAGTTQEQSRFRLQCLER